jgi:hypothetical protein
VRVSGLLLRLVAGEVQDPALFPLITNFFKALAELPEDMQSAAETLAVLRMLSVLGLDAGELPEEKTLFTQPLLAAVAKNRAKYIVRINHGIEASGL